MKWLVSALISVLRRLRQEDPELEAGLDDRVTKLTSKRSNILKSLQ